MNTEALFLFLILLLGLVLCSFLGGTCGKEGMMNNNSSDSNSSKFNNSGNNSTNSSGNSNSSIFNNSGNINATTANTDGLIVSFSGDLKNLIWAAPITSSDGYNTSGFTTVVDGIDNIYIGGTAALDKTASSNYINLYNYNTVSSGHVTNTLFGSIDVTNAIDEAGFIVKYT